MATELAGDVPAPKCGEHTGKKIAIVGGGPSGLSAAYYLQLMGHQAVVYENRKTVVKLILSQHDGNCSSCARNQNCALQSVAKDLNIQIIPYKKELDEQAVISPSWSIHSGCGSRAYTFIWGMVGENQAFDDMDAVGMKEIM